MILCFRALVFYTALNCLLIVTIPMTLGVLLNTVVFIGRMAVWYITNAGNKFVYNVEFSTVIRNSMYTYQNGIKLPPLAFIWMIKLVVPS